MQRLQSLLRPAWVAGLVLAATVWPGPPGALAAGPNTGKLSLTGGADITTAYFFRGLLQERDGVIVQPYADLGFNLYDAPEDILSGVTANIGTWNSFHSKHTGAGAQNASGNSTMDIWYEMDWYAGGTFELMDALSLGASWVAYTYPNQALKTVQEVDLTMGLDDSDWLGSWALHPSTTFAIEYENTGGLGGASGTESGAYFQLDIAPGMRLIEDPVMPIDLSFPVSVGLALDGNYYNGDIFGFAKYGPQLTVPIRFIPEDYGSCAMTAAVSFYSLGTNARALNKGENFWTVGTWGISMAY